MLEGLFYLVASFLIQMAIMPKQQAPKPQSFEEIDFPQVDEGTPQCVIFGDCWIPNWQVLSVGNYRTEPIRASGGKK